MMAFGDSSVVLPDLGEFAGNVGGVRRIQDWSVAAGELTIIVQDDNLRGEVSGFLRWVVLGVTDDVATTQFLARNVPDVVSENGFLMHLNGLESGALQHVAIRRLNESNSS